MEKGLLSGTVAIEYYFNMRIPTLAVAAVAVLTGCQTQQSIPSAIGTLAVKAAVDSLWSAYAHASDQKDAAAFGALFTEDAALVVDHAPTVKGRQAIEERLVSMYSSIDPTGMRVDADETKVSGTIAVQSGNLEERFNEKDAEKTRYGRFVLVAESEKENVWKIRRLVVLVDSTVTTP